MRASESRRQHASKRKRLVTSCSECYRRKQRCDRKNPCNNCLARKIPSKCRFNTSLPSPPGTEQQLSVPTVQPSSGTNHSYESETENVDFGYSLISGSNAFVDLQEVLGNEELRDISTAYNGGSQFGSSNRDIESLIAKLPPRTAIEALVNFFFDEVNCHYFILERFYFDQLFSRWPPKKDV